METTKTILDMKAIVVNKLSLSASMKNTLAFHEHKLQFKKIKTTGNVQND